MKELEIINIKQYLKSFQSNNWKGDECNGRRCWGIRFNKNDIEYLSGDRHMSAHYEYFIVSRTDLEGFSRGFEYITKVEVIYDRNLNLYFIEDTFKNRRILREFTEKWLEARFDTSKIEWEEK